MKFLTAVLMLAAALALTACGSITQLGVQRNPYTGVFEQIPREAFIRINNDKSMGNGFAIGNRNGKQIVHTIAHYEGSIFHDRFAGWNGGVENFALAFAMDCPDWDDLLLATQKELPPIYLSPKTRKPQDHERLVAVSWDAQGTMQLRRGYSESLGSPIFTTYGFIPETYHFDADDTVTFVPGNSGSAVFIEEQISGKLVWALVGHIDARPAALPSLAFFIPISEEINTRLYQNSPGMTCILEPQ